MFDIEEELKKLPAKPGVYIMRNKYDAIIYIGKAIILKNRVRQYFQSSRNLTPKIRKMVSQIDHFEYIITDSELEALILECNLIKEHRPKYNTKLVDDKSYPYIRVTVEEAYPRVMLARERKKDKSKYFGPFTSSTAVKETIDLLQKIYQIRTCNRNLPKDTGKERPCLNYHMGQCQAPCQGYIPPEEYSLKIKEILEFLGGNYSNVTHMLEGKMKKASEDLLFEEAATYRDLLNSVKQIATKQKITNTDLQDRDVIAFEREKNEAVVQTFFIRGGKLIGRDHYHLAGIEEDTDSQIMTSFLKQFYAGTPYIPKEILLGCETEEIELLEEWLTNRRGQKVSILIPKKGDKEKLVELAKKNAALVLKQDRERIKKEEAKTKDALMELSELIGLEGIERIESFDISNTAGFESVGSMVVYENGKPKKADYRKFKIKSVKGPDDYASMYEMLTRRFEHGIEERTKLEEKNMDYSLGSFTKFPDLILMDGGKGQVGVALRVLDELRINIPVCGMVKDDNHRTRGLYYNNEEVPMQRGSEAFRLVTRIQDETHRFAIEYHRSLRSKKQIHSVLDEIEGIGPTRRRALMKYFASIESIREASIDDIKKAPSMNEAAATKVYEFFHQ